ncbi:MAG: dipicolinate synthase subunit DpsA [Oscillospiraceae bacterium]
MLKQKQRLLVAGGDLRQIAAARRLAEYHEVEVIGFDVAHDLPTLPTGAAQGTLDHLILPMPVTRDGVFLHMPMYSGSAVNLQSLLPLVKPGGMVMGGRWTEAEWQIVTQAGLRVADYSTREEFAVRNAVPTAEGALQLAMEELPVTIRGLHSVILGAGRISRVLQPMLRALGADVTVVARRCSDIAWSKCAQRKPHLQRSKKSPYRSTGF